MSVTITSRAFVNDDTAASERFDPIVLDPANAQVLVQARNRIVSDRPAALSFRGRNLLAVAQALENVEARGLAGPRANMAGFVEALVREGELVTLSFALVDGEELERTGIITDLAVTVGPGSGVNQSIDLVFHRVDRVRYVNSSMYVSAVRDGAWA